MTQEPSLYVDKWGDKRWMLNDKHHRVDGPAVEWANGSKTWCLHGNLHRVDGPAVERADGSKSWVLNSNHYTFDDWLEANIYISDEEKVMLKLTYG
jgi:hypothetical protein